MQPFSLFHFLHTLLQPSPNPAENAENEQPQPAPPQEKTQENALRYTAYEQFIAQHNSRVNRAKKP